MPAATSASLPAPVGIEHLDRQDRGLRRDPGLGQAVALDLGDRARDVRAVAVVVGRSAACRAITFQPGSRRPARSGAGATPVSTTATTTPAPRVTRPGRAGADRVEAPLLRAARIGHGRLERVQAAQRLGVAHSARAPQGAQRRRSDGPRARRTTTARSLRHGAHLHGAGGGERRRGERARPQADDDGVAGPADGRERAARADDEDGASATAVEVRIRHAESVAAGRVTAQARGVPDV